MSDWNLVLPHSLSCGLFEASALSGAPVESAGGFHTLRRLLRGGELTVLHDLGNLGAGNLSGCGFRRFQVWCALNFSARRCCIRVWASSCMGPGYKVGSPLRRHGFPQAKLLLFRSSTQALNSMRCW